MPDEIEVCSDAGPEVDADPADSSGMVGVAPSGRRLVAATAIVGVVALVLGWLMGSSARSDEVAITGVTTTPETTEAMETESPAETIPLPPTTTTPRTTTTTTLAPRVVETVEIDARLVGIDQRLVGLERDPITNDQGLLVGAHLVVVELDLAEQTLTRTDVGRHFDVEAMIAGDDWVIVVSSAGNARLIRGDEPVEPTLLRDAWELRWQVGTDRFWQPDTNSEVWGGNGPQVWEEIDVTGEPTGATLELPIDSWVQFVDPRGGLVIEATGKHYSVDGTDISLLGSGRLVALSSETAVLWDCDDQLRCGLVVVDRATETVRQLETDALNDTLLTIEAFWGYGGVTAEMISPDGELCAVVLLEIDRPKLGLIDLRSGSISKLEMTPWPTPAFAWSPDSRFAFFLEPGEGFGDGLELRAFDRVSEEAFSVFTESRTWYALAPRPDRDRTPVPSDTEATADDPAPLLWEIDVDDPDTGDTVRMIVDFGPLPDSRVEDVSGSLIWDETEVALCSVGVRDEAPAGHLTVGDIFQTSEGCGDDPTAMQDAFDEFGLPEAACVAARIGGVDHTFCAPLTVAGR